MNHKTQKFWAKKPMSMIRRAKRILHITAITALGMSGAMGWSGAALADCINPASPEGGLAYFTVDDTYRVCNGSDVWVTLLGDDVATGVFEVDSNVVRGISGTVDYSADDFVFGSPSLSTRDANYASRLFFDKSKSAFRAGSSNVGGQWDSGIVGTYSAAFGSGTLAQGAASFAAGLNTQAAADRSFAHGDAARATGATSLSIGTALTASGSNSVALGREVKAAGVQNTFAFGLSDQTNTDADRPQVSGEGSMGIFMDQADNYNLTATDQLAIIGGELMIDTDAVASDKGCIRYNDTDDVLEFSNDCTTYDAFAGGSTAVWEVSANVVRGVSGTVDYSTDDFVFGSPTLDFSTETARMFFDKSKAAFRAGQVNGSAQFRWDGVSVGKGSAAFGFQTLASGEYSFASNFGAQAQGDDSIAMGHFVTATGANSLALGREVQTTSNHTFAVGIADQTGTAPQVSGSGSFGIFMDDAPNYNLTATDQLAIIGGELMIDTDAVASDKGCIRYNDTDDVLEFSHDCATYTALGTDATAVWETVSNVTRPTSGTADYSTDDFVFGSYQLDEDAGTTDDDARMLFDKSTGAFRAGYASGTQWDTRGNFSVAFGRDSIATGANSAVLGGRTNTASGQNSSVVSGQGNTATSDHSIAWGFSNNATTGSSSTAFGAQSNATGTGALAGGLFASATGGYSRAVGSETLASGYVSSASGHDVFAGSGTADATLTLGAGHGHYSIATGLQSANQATRPKITGDRSMVLFFDSNVADANSSYDFTESDKFALIGGEFQIGETQAQGTDKGCIRYNDTDDVLEFSHDCATYTALGTNASAVWEVDSNVVRGISGTVDYSTDDFVFGSPTLDSDGTSDHFHRMFFDKDKAAFRAGFGGSNWDSASIGSYSTAMGVDILASGTGSAGFGFAGSDGGGGTGLISSTDFGSMAWGSSVDTGSGSLITASGEGSTAWGYAYGSGVSITASGKGATAWGNTGALNEILASGDGSTAFGNDIGAIGNYSVAIGAQSAIQAVNPVVSGDRSVAIFFDAATNNANSGYNLSETDKFALIGGEFQIDDQSSTANKGCIKYDSASTKLQFSHDCSVYSDFGSGGGSVPGSDTQITFNDSGVSGANANFVFNSADEYLGIGTASPTNELTIEADGAFGGSQIRLMATAATTGGMFLTGGDNNGAIVSAGAELNDSANWVARDTSAMAINMDDGVIRFNVDTALTAGATFTPTERARFDNAGNLGIGDGSPDAHLEISLNTTTGGDAFLISSDDNNDGDIFTVQEDGHIGIANASPDVELDVTGDIEYTGTITDVSDRRLKTNITPMSARGSMLSKLDEIGTYSFVMKDDEDKRVEFGVMAQEIERVFPELVRTADDDMGTKSVNYVGLIAPLIEANKELRAEKDAMNTRIETLEAEKLAFADEFETLKQDVNGLKAHTGYGFSKAQMGLWALIGMLGMGVLIVLLGRPALLSRNAKK